jgi:AcrR family transcriptional regulator
MNRRKRNGSYHHGDLKAALIAETERMVAADELDRVTLDELSRRLGVARSAAYRHFRGKDELLCAVATRAFARMRGWWHDIRTDAALSTDERFRKLMRTYFRFALANQDCYRLMYREGLVGERESPELAAAREAVFAEVVALMEAGQRDGLVAAGDAEAQVLFCWAPFHGMASFVIDQHLPAELFESMLEWTIESMLRGLRTPPA